MKLKLVAAIVILALLVVNGGSGATGNDKPGEPKAGSGLATVAVLQFKNLCGDTSLDWLGFGFAESLCTKLANAENLQVVERTRLSEALKELKLQDSAVVDPKTAGKLGKIVGAKYVIIGSFQKLGDEFKADARRVEVETSVASSGVEATGKYEKVFDIQSELAIKLMEAFGKKVTAEIKQEVAKPETKSMTAYEYNAKGLRETQMFNFLGAVESFTKAIEEDSNYCEAYYNRGGARFILGDFVNAQYDLNKAVELDPKNVMAYVTRGMAWTASMNFPMALADFNKAIEVAPKDFRGYAGRAIAYNSVGNTVMAMQDLDKVIQLNPRLPEARFSRALFYIGMGNIEAARADVKKGEALGGVCPPQIKMTLDSYPMY
jgi:tetratricopeptide (TPR) repeat protein